MFEGQSEEGLSAERVKPHATTTVFARARKFESVLELVDRVDRNRTAIGSRDSNWLASSGDSIGSRVAVVLDKKQAPWEIA